MALNAYLVDEVAEDLADGLITRREALRRLGLLGVGLAASTSLLAACGGDGDDASDSADTTTSADSGTGDANTIRFDGESGELIASWAAADDPKGALLIVHENRGLVPHFLTLPSRFAAEGYSSLCVDLLSPEGGTASLTDEAAAQAGLGAAPIERLIGDLRAGIDELERRVPDEKIGAIGFCFGGGMVWNLLQEGETRLAAAAPFYGPAPSDPDFSKSKAAVFAVYGELDTRVNASRESAEAALKAADLTYEVKTYPGADHAFFNDTGARYNETAARQANTDVLAWFDKHLA
jgi:carboxymethylenebutenolidase